MAAESENQNLTNMFQQRANQMPPHPSRASIPVVLNRKVAESDLSSSTPEL